MAKTAPAAPLWSRILVGFLLWVSVEAKPSIPMDYCSTINTASMPANQSIYQSDGLCNTFCAPSWALAIVNGDSCWCSNFVPSKSVQVAVSQCSQPCPGFPDDVCGGDGVYGYMILSQKPSGTLGTGQTTPSSSSSPAPGSATIVDPNSSSTTSSGSSSTTTTSQTSNDNNAPTSAAPQVITVTTGGQTKTVIITPTPPPASSPNAGGVDIEPRPTKHGLSAGAAAGIAVAVIVAFLFVAGMLGWIFIKRRRAAKAEDETAGSGRGPGMSFSSNRASSAAMTSSTPRTGEMSETRYYMGANGAEEAPPDPNRRRSTLMPVDPRLDPFAKGIYNRAENKSHDSVNTIRDDHDYSRKIQDPPRVLRAMNPDSDID